MRMQKLKACMKKFKPTSKPNVLIICIVHCQLCSFEGKFKCVLFFAFEGKTMFNVFDYLHCFITVFCFFLVLFEFEGKNYVLCVCSNL
ncbi:hypothetical protein ES288_A03G188300v1 [Gossypium darwinii]|uniref:Uncharacterized protein n=1 Tax=Gossypium darwinii TaxID=34276 RepID=A0A5D2H812_GOSDA|nr:hypothetical protein ES288_A03G188300v1 [Gossypium darwinii]